MVWDDTESGGDRTLLDSSAQLNITLSISSSERAEKSRSSRRNETCAESMGEEVDVDGGEETEEGPEEKDVDGREEMEGPEDVGDGVDVLESVMRATQSDKSKVP